MKLSFFGAVQGVTGSCYHLETKRGMFLVDAGLFQDAKMCSKENYQPIGFDPSEIDAILITHAHLDHVGRLPFFYAQGFRGTVYATPPTKALMRLVLEDAVRVMQENAELCGDDILYSPEDVVEVMLLVKGVNYHTEFEPSQGIRAMFHDSGHILGSAFLSLRIPAEESTNAKSKTIVFSGDIGNDHVSILPDTEPIHEADVIICESTYGDREHEAPEMRSKKLVKFISNIITQGGTVIIPAFSIERTQELIYEIDRLTDLDLIPHVPVFLDSPLAIRATQAYRDFSEYLRFDRSILTSKDRDFFSFPRLVETLSVDESRAINAHKEAKIIIAGSGMMTGGRVLHHLKRYLPDAKSGVLIVGFQAEGTLGRQIEEGQKEVTIFHEPVAVRAKVEKIEAFSAHADRKKLRTWLKPESGEVEEIILTHGENKTKESFRKYLEETHAADIYLPAFGDVIVL